MDFGKILRSLAADMERPAPKEVAIREDALANRAADMARRGYAHTAESLAALEAYMKGYGLWLCGKVGTGKTLFFRMLKPMRVAVRQTGTPPRIAIFPLLRTLGMSVDDLNAILDEHQYDELVLDDAGAEPLFNFYGDKMEILPYILDKRMESPCRTHMTGNLTPKEMGRRYGARVADRFVEMFSYHQFGGASHRTLRPNADIRRAQVAALAAMKPKGGDFLPSGLTPPDENAQNRATGTPRINPQGENGETTAPEARSA